MGVLGDTFQWTDSDQVIVYLKQSLWALKALQFFHDNLQESLSKIGDARNEMITQINMGPGRRHEVLEQMCQGYIDDFERQHGKLVTISQKFQHRIEHLTRFRDGVSRFLLREEGNDLLTAQISSVSSLEDGQTSMRQDNNLQILTWVTTGYLPLGFVAVSTSVHVHRRRITDSFMRLAGPLRSSQHTRCHWRRDRLAMVRRHYPDLLVCDAAGRQYPGLALYVAPGLSPGWALALGTFDTSLGDDFCAIHAFEEAAASAWGHVKLGQLNDGTMEHSCRLFCLRA